MFKSIQWFIEKLIERLVPLVATSVSSTFQTIHALGQAEQQDQLEEAARRYENEGKVEIARELRQRAAQLTSTNPANEGTEIYREVVGEDLPKLSQERKPVANLTAVENAPTRPRKAKGRASAKQADSIRFLDVDGSTEESEA